MLLIRNVAKADSVLPEHNTVSSNVLLYFSLEQSLIYLSSALFL